MFYRQIILNKGIPFSLTIPKHISILEEMSEKDFHFMMSNGYVQAQQGESYGIDEVFSELENDL